MVVLGPTFVIVDAFADIYSHFPFFSSVPAGQHGSENNGPKAGVNSLVCMASVTL